MAHQCAAGHGCHDLDSCEVAFESLFPSIDTDNITCLNEQISGSIKSCFHPFSQKDDTTKHVDSDADEQLIIHIPFTADVAIRTLTVVAPQDASHPRTVKAFINRNDVDFDSAPRMPPVCEWVLQPDPSGVCEYPVRAALFQGVQSLTLFVESNHGADATTINFIGLRGTSTKVVRNTIIKIAEVAARPEDHKNAVGRQTSLADRMVE